MKILIFGAGGVGSVVGGFLARTGHEVSLLGRSRHLDVIRKNGLSVTGIWGDYRIKAFDLYTDVSQIPKEVSFDLIILTVKAFDTEEATGQLSPLLSENTVLLSLQNGLGNMETILKKVAPERLLMGRLIFGVDAVPGMVTVTVNADAVHIGHSACPSGLAQDKSPRLSAARMAAILNTAKIPAKAVPDILPSLWSKVIYNSALNAICTIHEIPYGKILEKDQTRALMREIVRECYAVGHRKGIALEPATAEEYIDLLTHTLIPKTASHFPSMLQDVRRGKKTDIEALNGAIVRLGQQSGIPTPANESVIRLLTSLHLRGVN